MGCTTCTRAQATVLAGIRAGRNNLRRLPRFLFKEPSGRVTEAKAEALSAYRCGDSAG